DRNVTGVQTCALPISTKYKGSRISNLPFAEDNAKAHTALVRYAENILTNVQEKNMGLFLYSVPNSENELGTGTGKTTGATALVNEYVIERGKSSLKEEQDMKENPAWFVKL